MAILSNIYNAFLYLLDFREFETFFKLILIVILAGTVGYERESWKKPAGFRTYVLVGISSVLVMICGDYIYNLTGADPTRIPAQLLSGIGFLGAGTILRDGFNVKGLTTAAALLAVTCIGLAVGSGYYVGAIIATLIVYFVLSYSHIFSGKLEHSASFDFVITTSKPKEVLDEIEKIFSDYKLSIEKIKIIDDKENMDVIKVQVKPREKLDVNKLIARILKVHTVRSVVESTDID